MQIARARCKRYFNTSYTVGTGNTPLFTSTQFNRSLELDPSEQMLIIHFNLQPAVNKADQLTQFLAGSANSFGAIFLTETWYCHDNDVLQISGYDSFYTNRTTKREPVVAILVKTKYSAHVLSEHCFCNEDIEIFTVKLARQTFSVIYRPPHENFASFFCTFERELFFFTSENVTRT